MYKIKTFNTISKDGLEILENVGFEVSSEIENPEGILLRSHKLHNYKFDTDLTCIGRAGAGVNNIPVDKCTESGVVVFNAPGANANAVKEIVLAGLFLASRDIIGGIEFSKSLVNKNVNVLEEVESNKSKFKGSELKGKRLGVLGLGAIGMMVSNAALNLGLDVSGHDPFISVNRAWELSSHVKREESLSKLFSTSDFLTLHMPLTASTKGFLNAAKIKQFKKGVVLLNFARPEIVEEDAIIEALNLGVISLYITDFPSEKLLAHKNVIPIPHLGASTIEAENNCSIMVANQMKEYLINGNIVNSVNYPTCSMERTGDFRIVLSNENIPNMVGQISSVLAEEGLNIVEMINKSTNNLAYTIVDLKGNVTTNLESKIQNIEGVLSVRIIK
jgi:D-3-phosphoglycerate dehydrogenase / 2-oxoglutarate reductase